MTILVTMDNFCFKVLTLGLVLSFSGLIMCNQESQYKEQTAIEGTSYKMKCTGMNGDDPSISSSSSTQTIVIWSINGTLPRGSKYKLMTDGLVIRNVSKEDTFANYTCTVLDRLTFDPLRSERIKLRLRQRAGKSLESRSFGESVITEKKVRVWGIVNQWVKLQCNMYSKPSPTFEWTKENSNEKLSNSGPVYKIVEDHSSSNLTIFLHNETFFGEYSCKAFNNYGESIQHFMLVEGYKPKAPFIYPTFIGKDRLTLKVEPQEVFRADLASYKEALPITTYLIQYIEADSLSPVGGEIPNGRFYSRNKKWTTITMTADGMSPYIARNERGIFELRNLKGNMTYLVRCAIANAAAISDFSPSIRITTDANTYGTGPETVQDTTEGTMTPSREEYGRSSNYQPQTVASPNNSTLQQHSTRMQADCQEPQYKKTIIRTTTSTTMIEKLADNGNSTNATSSLVRKRVEEDTSVEQMLLCSI